MTDRDPHLAAALNSLVPSLADEHPDWDRVRHEAHAREAPTDRRTRLLRVRRPVLVAIAMASILLGVAFSALAVGTDWFLSNPGAPTPVSQVTTIGSGGSPTWTLKAYVSQHDGICAYITIGDSHGAANCGFDVRGQADGVHAAGYAVFGARDLASKYIFGLVADDVNDVDVRLSNGETAASSFLSGNSVGNFYVAELPADVGVDSLVARGSDGAILERRLITSPVAKTGGQMRQHPAHVLKR